MSKKDSKDNFNSGAQDDSEILTNYQAGYVTLPFDHDQFKDFVRSLLGKPQTINKTIYGIFDISMKEIQNFHCLIDQRLTQQNKALLIEFRAKILFSDDSSVELNSFSELATYNEIRPIVSTGIELSWNYLIQFNDKEYPEKQEIILSIRTRRKVITSTIYSQLNIGFFDISIQHTARTWGTDILSLLENHIQSLLEPEPKIRSFVQKNSGWIGLFTGITFFLSSLIGTFWSTNIFVRSQLENINKSISISEEISHQISIIAQYIAGGSASKHYLFVGVFLFVSFIASITAGVVVSFMSDNREPSFILLTENAKKDREIQLKARKSKWRNFVASFFLSLAISVLANYIFLYLTQS